MKQIFLLCLAASIMYGCNQANQDQNKIISIINNGNKIVTEVLVNSEQYEVQILYTQIDRDSLNIPHFTTYSYRVNPANYFYPASTVKFPATVLALEKINGFQNPDINRNTTLLIDSVRTEQTSAFSDSTSENGLPSVAQYIRKILMVSDNDAFNRLYEFIGQQPFNERLQALELNDSRIQHRLSVSFTNEENLFTNPWKLVKGDSILFQNPLIKSDLNLTAASPIFKGIGYYSGDSLINEPFEFTYKNSFPLEDQQELLKKVLFPNATDHPLQLTPSDYTFLYQYLSQFPSESTYPNYTDLPDNYCKYLFYGDGSTPIDKSIRIFNKIGQAYGYLTDNAYFMDEENGVEFLLAATIHVNKDQIFNDDAYEYDEIGVPFLTEIGRSIYEYEKERPKVFTPNFNSFKVSYDR